MGQHLVRHSQLPEAESKALGCLTVQATRLLGKIMSMAVRAGKPGIPKAQVEVEDCLGSSARRCDFLDPAQVGALADSTGPLFWRAGNRGRATLSLRDGAYSAVVNDPERPGGGWIHATTRPIGAMRSVQ
jgi:hypothetical protein